MMAVGMAYTEAGLVFVLNHPPIRQSFLFAVLVLLTSFAIIRPVKGLAYLVIQSLSVKLVLQAKHLPAAILFLPFNYIALAEPKCKDVLSLSKDFKKTLVLSSVTLLCPFNAESDITPVLGMHLEHCVLQIILPFLHTLYYSPRYQKVVPRYLH